MSRTIRTLIPISLALLMCGVAFGKATPKYKMQTQGPAVDSRAWLDSHPSQGAAVGRNFGRQVSVGATASPGSQVGNTYYDYQHNNTTGRQVDEYNGRLQVSWMKAAGPSATLRTVNWNQIDVAGSAVPTVLDNGETINVFPMGAPNSPGGTPFAAVRPGYTNFRNTPTGNAIVGFHDAPETGGVQFWAAHVDLSEGLGVFGGQNQSPNPPGLEYQADSPIWPRFAVSSCGGDIVHHGIGTWSGAANEIWYWRGIVTGQVIDWTGMPGNIPQIRDSVDATLSAVIESYDQEVSIVLFKTVNTVNVDIARYVSTDCGLTWPTPEAFENLTNFSTTDADGAGNHLSAVYDGAGNLHALWDAAPSSGNAFPSNLYHWSTATGIRLVTSAGWINSCGGGTLPTGSGNGGGGRNAAISDVEISVKAAGLGPGAGIADELIYAIWTQFGPTDTDCSTVDDQGTLGGLVNGEIYCSVSSNGGTTWDRPANLTGTQTPDCDPGDCLSESWITAAATADSGVYISYVLDLHAGGIVLSEGVWTDNPYMVLAVEARTPVLEPVIAVTPQLFVELNAHPDGTPETVDLSIVSVGNADLTYLVEVTNDEGGASHVLVNGGASAGGTIAAGGAPDIITITYDCAGLGDPEKLAWRLEVTSNDVENDPGQGGTAINVVLDVFSASTWFVCTNDTLSTGLNVMQVSSCLEMGDAGTLGLGFWDPATLEEWMYSGSALITRVNGAGDTLAYHNAFQQPSDRTRALNKSFRAQSDFNIVRDLAINVGDSNYTADVATGDWSTTDTTLGGTYEMVFPKNPNLNNGAYFKYTMSTLTGGAINGVSYGLVADIDLDDPTGLGGSVGDNAGIANEDLSYVGGESGILDTLGVFTSYNTFMALFHLPLGDPCQNNGAVAGQVIANPNYVVNNYDTDSLYMLTQLFGALGSWGSNIHIDTGQAGDDVSVILIDDYNVDIGATDTITWGYGLAVSDVSVADMELNIAAIRAVANAACQVSCIIDVSGDVNVSGAITSADIIYLVGYVFKGAADPMPCAANGDVNCSGNTTSADIIFLVGHVFKGGAAPCNICDFGPECIPN